LNPVGIVTALPAEARTLLGRRGRGRFPLQQVFECGQHRAIVGGIGTALATRAAMQLIERGVSALISWGCAGGLHPDLRAGTLMLPEQILSVDGQYRVDSAWRSQLIDRIGTRLPVDTRPLLSSAEVLTGSAAKQSAFARHGAVAVDMESAAVAAVAASRNLPFLAVRAIADPQSLALPAFLPEITNEFGRPRLLRVSLALVRSPGALATLLALDSYFQESLRTLESAAELGGFAAI
jgi:adenosylhomocysteine nucleosidase